jgi:hypothetical protein
MVLELFLQESKILLAELAHDEVNVEFVLDLVLLINL